MPQGGLTFRIFVSSTFEDLTEERNALQKKVFPVLRDLCAEHECRFQAIDLRWGVSEEAGRDQRAMQICLDEIARCQKASPRPNFIVLLGDRYGWQPPPPEIEAGEFKRVLSKIDNPEDKLFLESPGENDDKGWYELDENADPPLYYLKQWPAHFDYEEDWKPTEARIHKLLSTAASEIEMDVEDISRYTASATEQEILLGAMRTKGTEDHVFGYFREIGKDNLPAYEGAEKFYQTYFDYDKKSGKPVQGCAQKLEDLKNKLTDRLIDNNTHPYSASWDDEKKDISDGHIDRLCLDVIDDLSRIILKEIEGFESVDAMEKELSDQEAFREDRSEFFTGRKDMLTTISRYLGESGDKLLAVWGKGGTGKSALAAQALSNVEAISNEEAMGNLPGTRLVYRFIGATPSSTDGASLLASLCRQITMFYGGDVSTVPGLWEDLVKDFPERLALATSERPLILFLDSLDQLSNANNARNLIWLPGELPDNVHLVVTTRPGPELVALRNKGLEDGKDVVELLPMELKEGEELLAKWLKNARRTLRDAQKNEVLSKFTPEGNPLYLKLAFEEARLWRSAAGVVKLALDKEGIIKSLYSRLSSETNHGEMLVSRSLGYLASTRMMYGLSEDEIIDVLSRDPEVYQDFFQSIRHTPTDLLDWAMKRPDTSDAESAKKWLDGIRENPAELRKFLDEVLPNKNGPRLPIVLWSRLYFDLEPYLAERSGENATLLAFYHRELGEVALNSYLGKMDQENRKPIFNENGIARQRVLAEYYNSIGDQDGAGYREEDRDKDRWRGNSRALSELPYHVTMAHMWDELFSTLTDFQFLEEKAQRGNVSKYKVEGDEYEKVYGGVLDLQEDYARALEDFPPS